MRLVSVVRLLAVMAVVLALSPAAASGERAMSSTQVAQVTVTVTVAGPGSGLVTSDPAGISCGAPAFTACSAQFDDHTYVTLDAKGEYGSNPGGFSTTPPYGCDEVYVPIPLPHEDACWFNTDYYNAGPAASIQVTFVPELPPHCIVPRATGRILARAKARIRQANCGVGTITHAFSHSVQKGRVVSQHPRARVRQARGAKVDLVVSRGRR